jgi:hypothetical protein
VLPLRVKSKRAKVRPQRANGEMSVGSPYGEPHRKDPQVVREREEALTAPRALLLRRAELIRVRAEHAAVTLPRPEHGSTARTRVEVLTGVLGHRLAPRRSAFRTRDRRLGDGHRASHGADQRSFRRGGVNFGCASARWRSKISRDLARDTSLASCFRQRAQRTQTRCLAAQ